PQQQVVELALDRFGRRQLVTGDIGHLTKLVLQAFVPRLRELLGKAVLLGLDRLRPVQVRAPKLVELEDFVDRRRLSFQLGGSTHPFRVTADELERQHYDSAFITGKRITSLTEGWSVSSITGRANSAAASRKIWMLSASRVFR